MDKPNTFSISPLILRELAVMEHRHALKLVRHIRLHTRQENARMLLWEVRNGSPEMKAAARKQSKANAQKPLSRGRYAIITSIQRLARCRLAMEATRVLQQKQP